MSDHDSSKPDEKKPAKHGRRRNSDRVWTGIGIIVAIVLAFYLVGWLWRQFRGGSSSAPSQTYYSGPGCVGDCSPGYQPAAQTAPTACVVNIGHTGPLRKEVNLAKLQYATFHLQPGQETAWVYCPASCIMLSWDRVTTDIPTDRFFASGRTEYGVRASRVDTVDVPKGARFKNNTSSEVEGIVYAWFPENRIPLTFTPIELPASGSAAVPYGGLPQNVEPPSSPEPPASVKPQAHSRPPETKEAVREENTDFMYEERSPQSTSYAASEPSAQSRSYADAQPGRGSGRSYADARPYGSAVPASYETGYPLEGYIVPCYDRTLPRGYSGKFCVKQEGKRARVVTFDIDMNTLNFRGGSILIGNLGWGDYVRLQLAGDRVKSGDLLQRYGE